MRLTAAITHEGQWFVARCLEVEVASQGHTIEDTLANLQEALELLLEDTPPAELMKPPTIAPAEVNVQAVQQLCVRRYRLSCAETICALQGLGFERVGQRGSHVKVKNSAGRVVHPLHHKLALGTFKYIHWEVHHRHVRYWSSICLLPPTPSA